MARRRGLNWLAQVPENSGIRTSLGAHEMMDMSQHRVETRSKLLYLRLNLLTDGCTSAMDCGKVLEQDSDMYLLL